MRWHRQMVLGQCGNIFITQNRTDLLLKSGIINSTIAVASIIAGLPFGIEGVAILYAGSGVAFRMPVLLIFLGKTNGIKLLSVIKEVLPSIAISSIVIACSAAFGYLAPDSRMIQLVASVSTWTGVYVACLLLLPRFRHSVFDAISTAREIVSSRSVTSPEHGKS